MYPQPFLRCSDNMEFMRALPDEHFKLIVTSPPYNIGKAYEARASLDAYLRQQEDVVRECVRLLRSDGSICWQVGNYVENGEIVPLDAVLFRVFSQFGLKMRNRIIWHFEHGFHCSKRLSGRYETINWWTKGDGFTWNLDPIRIPQKYPNKKHFRGPRYGEFSCNPKGKNPGDVWPLPSCDEGEVWSVPNVKSNHIEKTEHPCQFPVELIERLVLALTNPGDRVLDPYMGVGSTAIAAAKHHRHAYGCDIVPEYVQITEQRFAALSNGTLRVRQMGKPVYNPRLPFGGHA